MKSINKTQVSLLETAIRESLKNYESKKRGDSLSNLYLYYDKKANILFFYDDLENLLNKVQLLYDERLNYKTLRFVLQELNHSGFFDKSCIVKPFTVRLTDNDFIVNEEVFCLDDNNIKLEGNIWAAMEKDLDHFLKNLLQ
jgi:hypothetical protein